MRVLTLGLIVLMALVSRGQSWTEEVPVDSTLPIQRISDLDSLINFNAIAYDTSVKCVVVYTFRGCKPCAVLAKGLTKKIEEKKIAANQVVYVNSHVMNPEALRKYLETIKCVSPYYVTERYTDSLVSFYPSVDVFDRNGAKVWGKTGYSPSLIRKITKYLNQ